MNFERIGDLVVRGRIGQSQVFPNRRLSSASKNSVTYVQKVNLHCINCKAERTFEPLSPMGTGGFNPSSLDSGEWLVTSELKCCYCSSKKYFVSHVLYDSNEHDVKITKIAEHPWNHPARKDLSKFFKKDRELYNKAELCLDNGLGVGAYAYFRQILERQIDHIINSIIIDMEMHGKDSSALKKATDSHVQKNKIDALKKYLPSELIPPGGKNPISTLYSSTSEGIHKGVDEDLITESLLIKETLSFLVSRLMSRKKEAEEYHKGINSLG